MLMVASYFFSAGSDDPSAKRSIRSYRTNSASRLMLVFWNNGRAAEAAAEYKNAISTANSPNDGSVTLIALVGDEKKRRHRR